MHLDEDIPSLLVENTTPQEQEAITGWIRDTLSVSKETTWGAASIRHAILLANFGKEI